MEIKKELYEYAKWRLDQELTKKYNVENKAQSLLQGTSIIIILFSSFIAIIHNNIETWKFITISIVISILFIYTIWMILSIFTDKRNVFEYVSKTNVASSNNYSKFKSTLNPDTILKILGNSNISSSDYYDELIKDLSHSIESASQITGAKYKIYQNSIILYIATIITVLIGLFTLLF